MLIVSSVKKSFLVCAVFALSGLYSCIFLVKNWEYATPNLIFYFILLINTFFSIITFDPMVSKNILFQKNIEILLVAVYLFLSFKIDAPLWFSILGAMLFLVAIFKYYNLGKVGGFTGLIKRKIFVDVLGLLALLLTLIGVVLGFELASLWILAVAFSIVNFYLFFIKPLYITKI